MAITDLWGQFFQWFPWVGLGSGELKVRPEFDFLADFSAYSPPTNLPILAGLGRPTPVPERELQGIHHHEGTEKIWSCIDPYLPIQVVPELGLECKIKDSQLSGFQIDAYLHPFGCVAGLRFRLSIEPGIDGFRLARLLNNVERNGLITSRAHKFKQARTVVQLFSQVRDSAAAQVFVKPPRFRVAESPFCVLLLGLDYGLDIATVKGGPGVELMSALERHTGNQHADASSLREQFCVELACTARPNVPSGWVLLSTNGMAVYIEPGQDPLRATRAGFCDLRNIVKLLSFYRLYHAFVADAIQAKVEVPRQTVEHAVNALDTMRVKYSRWWIRWGTERLKLEQPLKVAVERYGLNRANPPNQKTSLASSSLTVDAVLNYKVFPTALAVAQPTLTHPLIRFNLTNPTGHEVDVTINCELLNYGNKTSESATLPPREKASVPIRFALKNPFPISFDPQWGQFDYSAYVELPGGGRKTVVNTRDFIRLLPIDTFVFACRNPVSGKISDLSWMIAAWVSKEQDALQPIVQLARTLNGGEARGYAVAGDVPAGVRAQVKAIYDALKQSAGITYDDSAIVYHKDSTDFAQRVRLPYRSLRDHGANCLDGSVLFASLLATVGLHPIILLLPHHAIVGWKTVDSQTSDIEFIETTVLAKEGFEEARQLGMQKFAAVKELADKWTYTGELTDLKEFAIPIDVEKEWTQRNVIPLPWR